ncbi:hypothetical protein ACM7HV_28350, partial [Pseudomonas paraeruginosa]|uniref:hypothetical protein n=3 Tax=Pseudomonas aeruginosa group TaxID=136841 RepID=UPI0039FBB367
LLSQNPWPAMAGGFALARGKKRAFSFLFSTVGAGGGCHNCPGIYPSCMKRMDGYLSPGEAKTRPESLPGPSLKGYNPCFSWLSGVRWGFSQGLRKNLGKLMAFHPTVIFLS